MSGSIAAVCFILGLSGICFELPASDGWLVIGSAAAISCILLSFVNETARNRDIEDESDKADVDIADCRFAKQVLSLISIGAAVLGAAWLHYSTLFAVISFAASIVIFAARRLIHAC